MRGARYRLPPGQHKQSNAESTVRFLALGLISFCRFLRDCMQSAKGGWACHVRGATDYVEEGTVTFRVAFASNFADIAVPDNEKSEIACALLNGHLPRVSWVGSYAPNHDLFEFHCPARHRFTDRPMPSAGQSIHLVSPSPSTSTSSPSLSPQSARTPGIPHSIHNAVILRRSHVQI